MAQFYRCSKDGSLYVFREPAHDATGDTTIALADVRTFATTGTPNPFTTAAGGAGAIWSRLPHTKSVTLSPDVTEAEKVRTSDTGGLRVKACSDSVSYNCEITSYLDDNDWLWNYLLSDPSNPGNIANYSRWFVMTESASGDTTGTTPNFKGAIFFAGRVTPGGISFDNEADAPGSTDWSVSVTVGPVFPGGTTFQQGVTEVFQGSFAS